MAVEGNNRMKHANEKEEDAALGRAMEEAEADPENIATESSRQELDEILKGWRREEEPTPAEEPAAPKQGLEFIVEMVNKLRESYPPDMWDGVPTDGAKNYKHYLYGHPKVEEWRGPSLRVQADG